MFGINRDNLGRFAKSQFLRKTIKLAGIVGIIWFTVHMFNATYVIKNSNGIHGVIARKTWEMLESNSEKASTYDTIPVYDYSSME